MGDVIRLELRVALLLLMFGWVSPSVAEEWLEAARLSPDQLADSSGRQGIPMQWQLNENQQTGSVSDNVLSGNVATGDNTISDNAFGNMSGIATVIQNTGNQVVIQDSTQVNILINQ
ncbi:MAG: hypothetical protein KGY54_03090 [Oleiphilaceae bacterium]|nr:hypothetical protein [Oleiphilaceae bacterium]